MIHCEPFEQAPLWMHYCWAPTQQKTDDFNIKLLWLIRKQTDIANYIIYFSLCYWDVLFQTIKSIKPEENSSLALVEYSAFSPESDILPVSCYCRLHLAG